MQLKDNEKSFRLSNLPATAADPDVLPMGLISRDQRISFGAAVSTAPVSTRV
ncbi:MAG: hypothetical protein OEW62_00040 [Candidatus Bathyarchaeota archaeon]|nr:hypothetical protein [Candidatus Bathyarchaeota archaeon]